MFFPAKEPTAWIDPHLDYGFRGCTWYYREGIIWYEHEIIDCFEKIFLNYPLMATYLFDEKHLDSCLTIWSHAWRELVSFFPSVKTYHTALEHLGAISQHPTERLSAFGELRWTAFIEVYIEKVLVLWDPVTPSFPAPQSLVKLLWIMPFLWEAVKTPEGHTYYYNSRQPLPFFWGFGGILMRSMLYIAEYECLRWRFVVVDGSISRDPGLDILRLHDQQFHPGPKTNKIQNFIDFHPIFPGITQTFPEFPLDFPTFSGQFQPTPGFFLPWGPGNRPGNVLWRSEDLWLHGIQETSLKLNFGILWNFMI